MAQWLSFEGLSLSTVVAAFAVAALVIAGVGTRMARIVDALADRTGMGEAMTGAVLLGGATSLAGIVASVAAAAQGRAELAVSNALGGIAVQTLFLALGDFFHRRANLEHAAASLGNLASGTLLIVLLATVLVGLAAPDLEVLRIHPASVLLLLAYFAGLRIARTMRLHPMWGPRRTRFTRVEDGEEEPILPHLSTARLWAELGIAAVLVTVSGFVVAQSSLQVVDRTGLDETLVGAQMTAIATSLPELVTTIAAIRAGALTLAVGGIVGGNTFDTLFVALSDFAYREGSIYGAVGREELMLVGMTILMTAILLFGLLRRQEHGPGNIGFESVLLILVYAGGTSLLALK